MPAQHLSKFTSQSSDKLVSQSRNLYQISVPEKNLKLNLHESQIYSVDKNHESRWQQVPFNNAVQFGGYSTVDLKFNMSYVEQVIILYTTTAITYTDTSGNPVSAGFIPAPFWKDRLEIVDDAGLMIDTPFETSEYINHQLFSYNDEQRSNNIESMGGSQAQRWAKGLVTNQVYADEIFNLF